MRKTILSDLDLHLFNEGNHYRAYEKLGSHAATFDGESGLHFAVWAPNADRVSVVGDFNRWDGRVNVCEPLHSSGIWTTFVPGLAWGEKYKYEVRAKNGALVLKADPYARRFEVPPRRRSRGTSGTVERPGVDRPRGVGPPARAAGVDHGAPRLVAARARQRGALYRDLADQLVP